MSTLPRQELNARQAETVEKLLAAAAEELRTVGPEAVTVRTVAGRAGVSPATAYTYFASRNHLFAELFWRKVLLEHPAEITGTTPLERVQSVTRQLSAVLAESPHLAAAANHALLGTDPDVERLRNVIGLDMFGRFREALGDGRGRRAARRARHGPGRDPAADRDGPDLLRRPRGPLRRARRHGHEGPRMNTLDQRQIVLDPYDYAFQDDPYPTYAWLREHEPLHHNEALDLWALTRHDDIAEAFRTEGTYSNSWGVAIEQSAWGPDAHRVMSILGMDPPRQNRLRALVSRGFTPRRVHDLLPRIQELTDRYLAECLEMGSFDWIADFAGKLPMDVISEMMGVPEEDRAEVRRQADIVVHREDGMYDVPPAGAEASMWLVVYYQAMVDQRRKQPTDDLTSALIEAELDGERLSDEDVIAFLFLMVVAGNETTTKLLGHALFHLTRHPDQLATVLGGAG